MHGCSESTIEKAKTTLQYMLDISKRWGDKRPATSHSSMNDEAPKSRAYKSDSSSAHSNSSSKDPKVFPIKPKEHGKLIEIWFNHLLPALPHILTTALKGDYTASLVRRGKDGIGAKPCILIESPHIPGKEAQNITREKVNKLCNKYGHQPIQTIFSQGSFRQLNGGADEGNDDAEEIANMQRLRFNLLRPSEKPGMGASLGLLRSSKLSATLGGYVLVGGTKYMLTSDHLIEESKKQACKDSNEKPAYKDPNEVDAEIITSPSRKDLIYLNNCLEQTKRDVELEIESLTKEIWGDQDIAEDSFSDQTPRLSDARNRLRDVESHIGQVAKQPSDYAIGTVAIRSAEPKTAAIPGQLARDLPFEAKTLTHYMDWALCRLTGESGENRHKYRSNEDALSDDYTEDQARANQPTDLCHETCDPSSGIAIYYVGQGSGHRSGVVNIPMLVKRDDCITHEWTILSSDGQPIRLPDVAGDSGAWVIRKNGNKLMGQVFAHSTVQVLFTPIDVIFADLGEKSALDVSLPPASRNPGQVAIAASATPLCSGDFQRPVGPLKFLVKPTAASADLGKLAIGVDLPETRPLEPSSELADISEIDNAHGQAYSSPLHDLPSWLPSLTDFLKSPATAPDSQQSSRSSGDVNLSDKQVALKKLSSESPRMIVPKSTESKIPFLTLDGQREAMDIVSSGALQIKPGFRYRITLKARTPTQPADRRTKVMTARVWSWLSKHRKSRDHDVATVARSVLDLVAWLDRRNGTCAINGTPVMRPVKLIVTLAVIGHIDTLRRSSKRKDNIPLMLEDVVNPGYSPISELCNVAT